MNPSNGIPKLKLELNRPVVISVTHPRGLPCTSRFAGDQVMWSLGDGSKFYGDPYIQARMDALGVQPNVPFELELVQIVQGNRRTAEVQVRPVRVGAGFAAHTPTAPVTTPPHNPTPTFIPPPPPPAPVNGAGETHAVIMQRCYCAAVDIALATIACAEKKGLRLTAQFEDVRAMGTALLISETGRR